MGQSPKAIVCFIGCPYNDLYIQLSGSTIVLTGGQLHPSLVTEYSGIDSGWQVFFFGDFDADGDGLMAKMIILASIMSVRFHIQ